MLPLSVQSPDTCRARPRPSALPAPTNRTGTSASCADYPGVRPDAIVRDTPAVPDLTIPAYRNRHLAL